MSFGGDSNFFTKLGSAVMGKTKDGEPGNYFKGIGSVFTGSAFKSPEMPAVEPLPSITSQASDDALKNAAKLEAESLRKRKGMKSTILTADSSLMAPEQTQKAQLLG